MKKEYIELYLEKCKEHKIKPGDTDNPETQKSIARYLMVNGWIPFTPENIALTGDLSWHISVAHLPKELRASIGLIIAADRESWEYQDEQRLDSPIAVYEAIEMKGVWLRAGKIVTALFTQVTKRVNTETEYTAELKHSIAPGETVPDSDGKFVYPHVDQEEDNIKLRMVSLTYETDAGDVVENFGIGDVSEVTGARLKAIEFPDTAIIEGEE